MYEITLQRKIDDICNEFESTWTRNRQPDFDCFLGKVDSRHRPQLLRSLLAVDVELLNNEKLVVDDNRYAGLGEQAIAVVRRLVGKNDVKTATFQRIASICNRFRAQWADGNRPNIADFVGTTDRERGASMFRNLLHIDVEFRKRANEHPSSKDYEQRFPEYSDLVRQAFVESLAFSINPSETKSNSPTAPQPAPMAMWLGKYRLIRELGRGGMGTVYEAIHLDQGTRVALKTLPWVDGDRLHMFKREFRALANINHLNLIGLHHLECDNENWFFSMDLIDGEDFLSFVRPEGKLNEQRLRSALAELVSAVAALHVRKIIHRDLKPSNVMVTSEGQVKVLDFGLVLESEAEVNPDSSVVGTPIYMAPEQFSGGTTTSSADWYAVGVMIYEALTGVRPFQGSIRDIFHAKQTRDAPAIPAGGPEDLAQLCRRLLVRDAAVRPNRDEIVGIACPDRVASGEWEAIASSDLVGRQSQLDELEEAIDSFSRNTRAMSISISGKSGEGKSVLAEHFLGRFRQDPSYTVLSGRCYDRESVPFKALDTVIDALCNLLRSKPDNEVRALISNDTSVLATLFPVLNRVPEIARLPRMMLENLELERVRLLAADALRELFRGLSASTTIVCFIDDLQWGDGDSAKLLIDVFRSGDSPKLLMLSTYRSDEAESSRFLQAWNEGNEQQEQHLARFDCRLGPLELEDCIGLVVDIVGVDNDAVRQRAQQMAAETGGNPYLLSELAGCYDPSKPADQPNSMEEIIRQKLARLPADARQLLDIVAVSGHSLSFDEAAQTAGHTSVPIATITRMRNERLVRQLGNEQMLLVDTYHDRIRETVLRDMDLTKKKSIHIGLAEQIEILNRREPSVEAANAGQSAVEGQEITTPRVYDLAYHFFEGGDKRAFEYQLLAGETATQNYALDDAIGYFKRAEQIIPTNADRTVRYRLWERLGQACGRTQRTSEAWKYYKICLPHSSNSIERAVVLIGMGEMKKRMGQAKNAISAFDDALMEVGHRRTKWLSLMLLETIWYLFLTQILRLIRPYSGVEARKRAEVAVDSLWRLSHVFLYQAMMPWYVNVCASVTYKAQRSGRPELVALGLAKISHNWALCSNQFMANLYLARVFHHAAKSQNEVVNSTTDGVIGMAYYCFGRLNESEEHLLRSIVIMNRHGESAHRLSAYHHLRHIYCVRGDSERELAMAEIELAIGGSAVGREFACWGDFGIADACARMGSITKAKEHSEKSLKTLAQIETTTTTQVAWHNHGFVLLQSSDNASAVEWLEKSLALLQQKYWYFDFMIRTYPLLLEALVGPDWLQVRRDSQIRRARRISRQARFLAWRFPNYHPHTMRTYGRLLCAMGNTQKGAKYFGMSIDSAKKLGAEFDLARAMLDLAAVDPDRRDSLRMEAVAILKRIKAVIPFAERWQLGDDPDPACFAQSPVSGNNQLT